jgi:hypothetical protein
MPETLPGERNLGDEAAGLRTRAGLPLTAGDGFAAAAAAMALTAAEDAFVGVVFESFGTTAAVASAGATAADPTAFAGLAGVCRPKRGKIEKRERIVPPGVAGCGGSGERSVGWTAVTAAASTWIDLEEGVC